MSILDIWRGDRPTTMNAWEPMTRDVDRMLRDMERTLTSIRPVTGNGYDFIPACDIDETEGEYHLTMDVPGVEKDDIHIEVVGNSVIVTGERKHEKEEKSANVYRLERTQGKFHRTFTLPMDVKDEAIEASYNNGVLCVTLPKSEKSRKKKINISSGKPSLVAKTSGKNKGKAANE